MFRAVVLGLLASLLWVGTAPTSASCSAAKVQGATSFPPPVPVAPTSVSVDDVALPPSLSATRRGDGEWDIVFSFRARPSPASVHLAGTFNGWNSQSLALRRGDDNIWRASIPLPQGRHLYKFVVNGQLWQPDPLNPSREDDGHGGANSVLELTGESALARVKARVGDGSVEGGALRHDPRAMSDAQCSALAPDRVIVRLRTLHGDVERASVASAKGRWPMAREGREGVFDWWVADCTLGANEPYTFVLGDGSKEFRMEGTFTTGNLAARAIGTPDWAKDAVWYQIMVDRFRNGDTASDPPNARPWTSEWYTPSGAEGKDGQTFFNWYVYSRLYGGDFQGVRERLGYLKELGVNALYLNPIFQSPSHHKYNASSYTHVDEGYGAAGDYAAVEARENLCDASTWEWTAADRVFLDFLKEAKAQGFRIILDGVFNHVGTAHPAFKDIEARGASSPYADWFIVKNWEPLEYEGWAGFGELPAFKKSADGLASESLKKHIFEATRRWMDPDGDGNPADGIDGWRLDVPMELPMGFWYEWCAFVRSINPDAYIVGEVWTRADQWLDGRSFDAVMNYPFASALRLWAGQGPHRITATEMDRRLGELRRAYAPEVLLSLQNLVGSHDTDRIASQLKNLNPQFDAGNREQENPKYDGKKPGADEYRRQRLIALAQMTYLGAPMIYYGDEVGMWGADDPTNRKPMLWADLEPYVDAKNDRVMTEHLRDYQRMIALRKDEEALRRGSYRTLLTDDDRRVWAFERALPDGSRIIVILNAHEKAQSVNLIDALGDPLTDALTDPLGDAAQSRWTQIFATDDDAPPQSLPRVRVPAAGGLVFKLSGAVESGAAR